MCLAAVVLGVSARYPLVFAANRDELHRRPSAAADWWEDPPGILGGRDLVAGGGWLAVDRTGRLAAVTNLSERPTGEFPKSRGWLVRDYLAGDESAERFVEALDHGGAQYGAFNLLLFDGERLHYASNRAPGKELGAGVHVLSNAPLGTRWPKIERAEQGLSAWLAGNDSIEALFTLLAERAHAPGDAGQDARVASRTSALFVRDEGYGTRCSTVIVLSADAEVVFSERRFDAEGALTGESEDRFSLPSLAWNGSRPRPASG